MLGMYRAELARVLHLQCQDIGRLADIKQLLEPDTDAWRQAVVFIRLYQTPFAGMQGEKATIHHWLRAENEGLDGVPLLLIVDDDRLREVLDFCSRHFSAVYQRQATARPADAG